MRCLACNVALSDAESTRKSVVTGDYIDLCNRCLATISEDITTTNTDTPYTSSERDNDEETPEESSQDDEGE